MQLIMSMFTNFTFENKEKDQFLFVNSNPFDQIIGGNSFFYQMHGKLNVNLNNFMVYVINNGVPCFEVVSTQARIKQEMYSYIFVIEKLKILKIIEKDLKLPVLYLPRVNV
jgi:hypothetical protein